MAFNTYWKCHAIWSQSRMLLWYSKGIYHYYILQPHTSLACSSNPLLPTYQFLLKRKAQALLVSQQCQVFRMQFVNAPCSYPSYLHTPSSLTSPHWHVCLAHLACLALQLLPCPGHWPSPWLEHSILSSSFINRPRVAGGVLQIPSSMIHSFTYSLTHWLSHIFPTNLQNFINHKP